METTMNATTAAAAATTTTDQSGSLALAKVAASFKAYTVLSAIALTGVVAMAVNGHTVNTFMWVRGVLLPVVAVLLYRLTIAADRGSRGAFDRVRALTLIMPVAIVGVDLIPGVCPLWYAALQAVCMVPVIAAAVITRGAAFPKTR